MTRTINAASLHLQDTVQRNVLLNDLAHWFAQVLPQGVLATGDARALYRDFLQQANRLERDAGVTDTELLVLILTASTCVGSDYEHVCPAARQVLYSHLLSQAEKAEWFQHFLAGFPYLSGVRFAQPIQRQSAPSGLLFREETSSE